MEKLFGGVINPGNDGRGETLKLRRWRGNFRARKGQWSEAAADFRQVLQGSASDASDWAALALLLVQQGEIAVYLKHRDEMVSRFRPATNTLTAERIARAALLLPAESDVLERASQLAQTAWASATNLPPSFVGPNAATNQAITAAALRNAASNVHGNFSDRLRQVADFATTNSEAGSPFAARTEHPPLAIVGRDGTTSRYPARIPSRFSSAS